MKEDNIKKEITIKPKNSRSLISIEEPKSDFERFLNQENNKRIFFSGKFGIGKTYFLQNFFEDKKEKYDLYHIFPVNYQISSNENIINLIKYDLLVELINKHEDAFGSEEDKNKLNILWSFIKKEGAAKVIGNISISVLSVIPALGMLGRPLNDFVRLIDNIKEFDKENKGDEEHVDNFIKSIAIDNKSKDYISLILKQRIEELKGNKKGVLIIDDFERIDPEHIFRILNVFSAHTEGEEENILGFDYVVIVGDVENIKSIFHHKYGEHTDFYGYFDKFFTKEIYFFDNVKAITSVVPKIIQTIDHQNSKNVEDALEDGGVIKNLLEEVLLKALILRKINLRQLYKLEKYQIKNNNINKATSIVAGVEILKIIFEHTDNFLNVLNEIKNNEEKFSTEKTLLNRFGSFNYHLYFIALLMVYIAEINDDGFVEWNKNDKKYGLKYANEIDLEIVHGDPEGCIKLFYEVLIEYINTSDDAKNENINKNSNKKFMSNKY